MTKKITAIFLALCMAISVWPMTIQAASKPDIKVGDYVKMGAYNNASILWRCVSIDNNGPLMLADKIVDTLAYDAKQMTTAIQNHTAEAISVMITVLTIGKTAICVLG